MPPPPPPRRRPGRAWFRTAGLAVLAPIATRLLFRLCLGRWPDGGEAKRFEAGLLDRKVPLPPCQRGMFNVAAAQLQVSRYVLLDMVRQGRLGIDNAFDRTNASDPALSVPPFSGDPLRFWTKAPIAFLHLEKTGGVSFAEAITGLFHPEQIDPDPQRTAAPHVVVPFAGRDAAAIRRRALIFGHYDVPSLRRIDPGRPIITLLREPERRILSLYYYWRSVDPAVLAGTARNEAVRLAQDLDLLAFLQTADWSVRNYIDNFYVRRLTGLYVGPDGSDPLAGDPEAGLTAALDALGRLEFVGITEAMEDSMSRLSGMLGADLAAGAGQLNAADDNAGTAPGVFRAVARDALTPAHREVLARLTRLDGAIYRAAAR